MTDQRTKYFTHWRSRACVDYRGQSRRDEL